MNIVLTTSQRNALLTMREAVPQMFKSYSTFEPIELAIKDEENNPYYTIPYKLLEDLDFEVFKQYVFDNLTTTIEIRILDESEYNTYEIE